jgi:hypothetical protein
MLQSALPLAVLIAIAAVALFRPAPVPAKARKCASRRTNR